MDTQDLHIEIDIEDMTIDEMAELESITGMAFRNIDWEGLPASAMKAMAYIFGKRQDPTFTLEDAGRVKVRAFMPPKTEERAAEADPTPLLSVNGVG